MKLQDVERAALDLDEGERATLVVALLDTLAAPGSDVPDEEVDRRDAELGAGMVHPIRHEEFVRRVGAERRR